MGVGVGAGASRSRSKPSAPPLHVWAGTSIWSARQNMSQHVTLPVMFLMLSQQFPSGCGHSLGWVVLLLMAGFGVAALLAASVLTARPDKERPASASTAGLGFD